MVMSMSWFIPENEFDIFVKNLSKKRRLFVPVKENSIVRFVEFKDGIKPYFEKQATSSAKNTIFPQTETLFRFEYKKDPKDLKKFSVEISETIEAPETVVLGTRPCDARGFLVFDKVFLNPKHPDIYYQNRREKSLFITMTCTDPEPTCFCKAVGSSPADSLGSDILITKVKDGFFVETITEKGEKLLNELNLKDGDAYSKEAEKVKDEANEKLESPFDTKGLSTDILKLFNTNFWEKELAHCLSCGVCTYLCPTCYCFNITDETSDSEGERIRTWDACMFFHFTLEGSGHNPRPTKAERFRNRVGHKFSYFPDKYDGMIACCGCGRCIKSCPASVDIRKVIIDLKEAANESA